MQMQPAWSFRSLGFVELSGLQHGMLERNSRPVVALMVADGPSAAPTRWSRSAGTLTAWERKLTLMLPTVIYLHAGHAEMAAVCFMHKNDQLQR